MSSSGSSPGRRAPSDEERRDAEALLRDGKRLVEEGLLTEEDFEEIKLRALGAFIWQRGGSASSRAFAPSLSSSSLVGRRPAAAAASSNALTRRRAEISDALRTAQGDEDDANGKTKSLPPGTEGCCPMGHRLQPYMPPKSLMAHFPGKSIGFAADGTAAQQVRLGSSSS